MRVRKPQDDRSNDLGFGAFRRGQEGPVRSVRSISALNSPKLLDGGAVGDNGAALPGAALFGTPHALR